MRFPLMAGTPPSRIPPKQGTREHDLFLLPTDGGRPIPLADHPAHDAVFGWAPDGKSLLFSSDRAGTWDAWLLPIDAGRPQGPPVLVKKDMAAIGQMRQVRQLGFTRNGSFHYRLATSDEEVFIATLDLVQGKVLVPPTAPIRRFVGGSEPDWSPDGQYLAYQPVVKVAAAFGRRRISAGCVAPSSNIPDILGRRALPAERISALGATPGLSPRAGILDSIRP
jgi:dipeptidyl aminopeptidase/acylaminoacyl peptidase